MSRRRKGDPARHWAPYTEAENAEIVRLVSVDGWTYARVAEHIGRTPDAIGAQFRKLTAERNRKWSRKWTPKLVTLVDEALASEMPRERLAKRLGIAPKNIRRCLANARRVLTAKGMMADA